MRKVQNDNSSKSKGKKDFSLSALSSVLTIAVTSIALFSLEASRSLNQVSASEFHSLAIIQKRGKLIIGVKDNLVPLGFRDRNGSLAGLEIDLARELAKELNLSIELVPLKNRDRLTALQNNQVDLAIAQITVTNNRSRLVDFSLPYYTDSTIVIARRGTTSQELSQNIAIAVLKNSASIAVIQSQFPKAMIIGANSYTDGLAALESGKVKAFVGDHSNLLAWLSSHPDYEITAQNLAVHSLAIALPRGLQHLELREQIFAIVDKWRKNGWLAERVKYWEL